MAIGMIGRKLGMSQRFDGDGKLLPVTVIQLGPCVVTQKKTLDKDGYESVQLGFESAKEKSLTKAQRGHLTKKSIPLHRHLREFKGMTVEGDVGTILKADLFAEKAKVKVSGVTKSKGFQGVVKRYGFAGGPLAHGSRFHRAPGSIGACADPSKVFKGTRLPGQTGAVNKSTLNLKVFGIDADKNLLFVVGAVPGPVNGLVTVEAIG